MGGLLMGLLAYLGGYFVCWISNLGGSNEIHRKSRGS